MLIFSHVQGNTANFPATLWAANFPWLAIEKLAKDKVCFKACFDFVLGYRSRILVRIRARSTLNARTNLTLPHTLGSSLRFVKKASPTKRECENDAVQG